MGWIGRSATKTTLFAALIAIASLLAHPDEGRAQQPASGAAGTSVIFLSQGWSDADRAVFYTTSQGSRIMPFAWFSALKHPDGQTLLADSLARYGYLPNARSAGNPQGLPVGFTIDARDTTPYIGMTCAACHTRQISMGDRTYRIDGGPAIVDFEALLRDIQSSVRAVLSDVDTSKTFAEFAQTVLGSRDTPQARLQLRVQVTRWFVGYDTIIQRGLPDRHWGLSRIDAIGMIFDRVAGLDLGIPDNIKSADAPVRYPFLWDASRQDKTQWPGFAQNGLDVLAMGRNTGEVLGVFASFQPTAQALRAPDLARKAEYLRGSLADFAGLQKLETELRNLTAPKWPDGWPGRPELRARGEQIFGDRCTECHGQRDASIPGTWQTPVRNVGTDPKEWLNLQAKVASGALTGTRQPPFVGHTLAETDTAKDVLANAVVGLLLADVWTHSLPSAKRLDDGVWQAIQSDLVRLPKSSVDLKLVNPVDVLAKLNDQLRDLFESTGDPGAAYEARVLHGIWSAAPYLHNGSVPTLAELLKPAAKRVKAFKIGPQYDPDAVGLAVNQGVFSSDYQVGDCDGVSGNGNCGHEYGTDLSPDDQRALLEFLKKL
jgi:mono/diheme cytochrome c family protein